jgi:hypothetical protein
MTELLLKGTGHFETAPSRSSSGIKSEVKASSIPPVMP